MRDWPNDVLVQQELLVVALADGYAPASNKPVLVSLHSAGSVGHALGHVFTAYRHPHSCRTTRSSSKRCPAT